MYYTAVSNNITCQWANVFLFTHQNQFLLTFGAWPVLILDPDWDSIEKEKWHDACCWRSMQLTRKCLFIHFFFSPRNTFVYDWEEFVCFWPGQTIFNPAVDRLTQRGLNFSFPVQSFSQVIIWALDPSDYSGFSLSLKSQESLCLPIFLSVCLFLFLSSPWLTCTRAFNHWGYCTPFQMIKMLSFWDTSNPAAGS